MQLAIVRYQPKLTSMMSFIFSVSELVVSVVPHHLGAVCSGVVGEFEGRDKHRQVRGHDQYSPF